MKRSTAIAGFGFAVVVGTAVAMFHPGSEALVTAAGPGARTTALMLAAMTFVVAAVIEHDR